MLHSGPTRPAHGINVVVVVVASVVVGESGTHEHGSRRFWPGVHVSPGGHEPRQTGVGRPPHGRSVIIVVEDELVVVLAATVEDEVVVGTTVEVVVGQGSGTQVPAPMSRPPAFAQSVADWTTQTNAPPSEAGGSPAATNPPCAESGTQH
jgi:hypothetical protein